jgi:hypothetical protein
MNKDMTIVNYCFCDQGHKWKLTNTEKKICSISPGDIAEKKQTSTNDVS